MTAIGRQLPIAPDGPQANALLARAAAAFAARKLEDAKALAELALQSTPADFDVLHQLGVIELQRGQIENGVRWLEAARGINPRHAELLRNLGIALSRLGRPQDAVRLYDEALAIRPDHADAYY